MGLFNRPEHWLYWLVRWASILRAGLWCLVLIPLLELLSLLWCGIVVGWSWRPVAHLLGMLCGVPLPC